MYNRETAVTETKVGPKGQTRQWPSECDWRQKGPLERKERRGGRRRE